MRTVVFAFALSLALGVAGGFAASVADGGGLPIRAGRTPPLPASCRPAIVADRVLNAVRAFNRGDGQRFVDALVPGADFHPYVGSVFGPRQPYLSHVAIARFVARRHREHDRWTAKLLLPPVGRVGLPWWTVYGVAVDVRVDGRIRTGRGIKLVVDCQTGRVSGWVGPSISD